ncbi:MAG: hypothetical protein K5662_00290 [Lachnospiraceae bacterium]|nr:hypothetical protein [Lachnospiraceae bacterium]
MNISNYASGAYPFMMRGDGMCMTYGYAAKDRQVNRSESEPSWAIYDLRQRQEQARKQQLTQTRELLRELNNKQEKNSGILGTDPVDSESIFRELFGDNDCGDKEEYSKPVKYNCKDVATRIQRAKTSVSAGQAVIAAKRKVLEVKRQIASGKGNQEELQLALIHAKRMEMAARKKKHHLELEELVEHTRRADEKADKQKEAARGLRDAVIAREEEKLSDKEDAIFEERQQMLHEAVEELREPEEAMEALGAVEELRELEEAMEALEAMEVIDPHMSEEELEELKRHHRASEQKAMMKADMDYLKGMMKFMQDSGGTGAVLGAANVNSLPGTVWGSPMPGTVAIDPMQGCGLAIDLQG